MTETGLFGGSFNPIHNGHIGLAVELLRQAGLDEVWFMVSPQNPLKRYVDLLDDEKRLNLVKTALKDSPGLKACDYEFHLPRPSYTWDTLRQMVAEWPDRRFTLLIGADNWMLFDHWFRYEEILNSYRIVVYPRRGCDIDASALPQGVTLAETKMFDISSTDIREHVRRGEPIDGLVPDCIRQQVVRFYAKETVER